MLVASPFPGAQGSGESSPGRPQLMTLPYLPTPGANSEIGIENTPLSQDDDFQNEINTFQGGSDGASCAQQIMCCCCPRGLQRVLYRNRRETLINVKAISSFLEMIVGAVVMYAVPEGNACDNAKYALLFYMLRLPFELPLLRSALEGFRIGLFTWVFDIMWSLTFFTLGIYLTMGTTCAAQPPGYWIGFLIVFGLTPATLFLTWPIVGKMMNDMLEKWKPILPNLHNERFATFRQKKAEVDEHDSCVICITEFEDSNIVTELPCGHYFHQFCVNQWLSSHNTCPMCRAEVPDDGWSPASEQFMTADEQLIRELELEAQNI